MNKKIKFHSWILLASKFLFGQGIIQLINILIGIIIIRFLPISQYALYILAGTILAIISMFSDMGLSQAANTIGAPIREDKISLTNLFFGALKFRRELFFIAIFITIFLSFFIFYKSEWPITSIFLCLTIVLFAGWFQTAISLKRTILNIHHDAKSLFRAGLSEALARLVLIFLCSIWSNAVVALLVNLIGTIVAKLVLSVKCNRYLLTEKNLQSNYNAELKRFILPLAPSIIYHMVQGQISYYLLSYSGLTQQIAQVGALARLGQFVGLLLLLNPFLIQPTFARIQNKKKFVSLVFMLGIGLFFLSFLIMISTYLAPKYWLLALGQNYSNLSNQLPLAIISSLFYFFGATIYTVLISRGFTRGQYYYLLIGLLGQIIYVGFFGISSSYDALILNVIPSISYFLIQISLLIVFIKTWKVEE